MIKIGTAHLMFSNMGTGKLYDTIKVRFNKKELGVRSLITRNGYPAKITETDREGYHEVVADLGYTTYHYVARPSGCFCSSSDRSEKYGATSPWDLFMEGDSLEPVEAVQ